MTALNVHFALAGSTKRRTLAALFGGARVLRTQVVIALVGAVSIESPLIAQLRLDAARHSNVTAALFTIPALYPLVAGLLLALSHTRTNWPRAGVLTFDDVGVSGTLDGRDVRFGWRATAYVQAVDEVFIVQRRGLFSTPIVVPKTAFVDPRAFWSQLDERLVAKRGLIRTPRSTRIVNTAH